MDYFRRRQEGVLCPLGEEKGKKEKGTKNTPTVMTSLSE